MEGSFEEPSDKERETIEASRWYIQAKEKAESFLPSIDPNLEVDIEESIVTPDDKSKDKYETLSLIFTHRKRPDFRWTMEIEKSDQYIENKLEEVVRKVYREKVSE